MEQVLVFDAGSSGTRVHVFNILPTEDPSRAHVPRIDLSVRSRQTLKVKPGLSHFAETGDLDGVQRNIEELINFTNQFVPAQRRATTPALLKATAGLRAVSASQAEAVLERVRQTLAATGYQFRPEWADIIKGKEEGGLAWVAANYLSGTFDQAHSEEPTIGVIEMGGGSTQVTFQVSDADGLASSDSFVFETALGKRYYVYAHSYLGFGQDHAQKHLRDEMKPSETEDPCYPRGYERKAGGALVKGIGDWRSCKANIEQRLMAASGESPGHYAREMPLSGSTFVATENFFYVQDQLELKLEDAVVDVPRMEKAAETSCSSALHPSPEEVAKMEAGVANADRPNSCFALSYQALLLQTLQVQFRGIQVRITHKINGGDVDWALGAALVHFLQAPKARPPGELLPSEDVVASSFTATWAPILLALLVVFLAAKSFMSSHMARQTFAQLTGIKPTKIGSSADRSTPRRPTSPVE